MVFSINVINSKNIFYFYLNFDSLYLYSFFKISNNLIRLSKIILLFIKSNINISGLINYNNLIILSGFAFFYIFKPFVLR